MDPLVADPRLVDDRARGKAELRRYWTLALEKIPDLRFELLGVYGGVDALVLHYRNQRGGLVNEVLLLADRLVREGYGTYLDTGDNLAGASRPSRPPRRT